MSYQRVNWENGPSSETPINADNLNIMDEGIASMEQKVTTGEEVAINEYIDGKQVYRKRLNIGNLPNTTAISISTGLDFVNTCELIRITGCARYSSGVTIPLPHIAVSNPENSIAVNINANSEVEVTAGSDRSAATGYIDLWYIKNN